MRFIKVVNDRGWVQHASLRRGIIELNGIRYWPVSVEAMGGGQTVGHRGSVAGAVGGGLLLGPAGLIAGALLLGGKPGETAFLVHTVAGRTLTCMVRTRDFPIVYKALSDKAYLVQSGLVSGAMKPRFSWFWALFTGPFYFLKFGILWFAFALGLIVLTALLAWPLLPFLARFAAWPGYARKVERQLSGAVLGFNDLSEKAGSRG